MERRRASRQKNGRIQDYEGKQKFLDPREKVALLILLQKYDAMFDNAQNPWALLFIPSVNRDDETLCHARLSEEFDSLPSFVHKGIIMKYSTLFIAPATVLSLSACDKPTVVNVPAPVIM